MKSSRPGSAILLLFSLTLFTSAFLLFLVQPMFAKMVLPLLGGTPAVWNTCMVFFQACLLAGYLYAHLTPKWLGVRRQSAIHLVLLALPLIFLPLHLPSSWSPGSNHPIAALLMVLALSVGVPFFFVATTGPLLQRWFAATGHKNAAEPYFLYAAGNTGSLLALVGYPALVEPFIRLAGQTHLWSYAYGLLFALIVPCALALWRFAPVELEATRLTPLASPSPRRRLHWIALAFVPSSYLLGITTFITTDIAAVPLFWIVPLALYLLSFILVFLKKPLLTQARVARLLPISIVGVILLQLAHAAQPVWLILLIHLAAFFLAAMACHGELARCRPPAEHLTDFYLMMSVGGVLGGLFNALLAPALFNRAYEYPIAIVLTCVLTIGVTGGFSGGARSKMDALLDIALPWLVSVLALIFSAVTPRFVLLTAALPVMVCIMLRNHRWRFSLAVAGLLAIAMIHVPGGGRALNVHRSFFGVHRIVLTADGRARELYHGATLHGRQRYGSLNQAIDEPLTYYHRTGPAGDVFRLLPHAHTGVIGLGVGSLAAYTDRNTTMTYYEIDRDVLWAAESSGSFHFLSSAKKRGATLNVVLGDARLTLRNAPDAAHDLLVLDAFSGDAVPVHLLTREALALYLRKLSQRGVLAVHTSNIYLDLRPVLAALARDAGCLCLTRDDLDVTPEEMAAGKSPSQWVVIARDAATLQPFRATERWQPYQAATAEPWTDDFSNVLSVMRWRH